MIHVTGSFESWSLLTGSAVSTEHMSETLNMGANLDRLLSLPFWVG
jgi:hypothetical protein